MRWLKYGIGFLGIFLLFASYRITAGPFLGYCVEHDHTRLTKIIAPIANPGYKGNVFDENLLHTAAAYGSPELVEVLLRKGMDPNGRDGGGGTPLINAAASCEEQNEETRRKIDLLLDHGADIWACDNEGNSVFFYAAGNLDCLKYLISRCPNFDPFVVNYDGENLLFGAIKHERDDNPAVIQYLVSQGVNPNSCIPFFTPIEEVCRSSNPRPRMVHALLDAGAQYGSFEKFTEDKNMSPEIIEILREHKDRQITETSETLSTRMDQERENVIRHQPPCESAYDIKMRRYYYYREERGMGKTYGYGGPPPESPDDADLKEMYEAELNRSHERLDESKTVTNIKWAFHVLFGG